MKKERRFSIREARALVWLLPVLAVVSWLAWQIAQPPAGSPVEPTANAGYDTTSAFRPATRPNPGEELPAHESSALQTIAGDEEKPADGPAPQLFAFDPNTIEYHDLVRLGFERGEALGIIKYRERGKVFEIPEDFAACYQVSEAMFRRLAPYIRIGEQFRLKTWAEAQGRVPDPQPSIETDGNDSGGFSNRDREVAGADARKSLSTDNSRLSTLVELNTADSAALIAVSGIGERTVVSIMDYRKRLGGFVDVRQLAEVRGMTEQNYERIVTQIFVDPAEIQKININFAPAQSLAAHPYIRAETLRKLLKQRQLKGGWRTPEELEQDDIFTTEELAKLGPYLIFN